MTVSPSILCTPERLQHARSMVLEPRDRGTAGNVIQTGHREAQECVLDAMYADGLLADQKSKLSPGARLNAGLWLRELYLETHQSSGVAAYSVRIDGIQAVQQAHEPSDEEAWNLKAYQDTAKALKQHWYILETVCCFDITPKWAKSLTIKALDALANLRDGCIPNYARD